jgi:hypothetical protein
MESPIWDHNKLFLEGIKSPFGVPGSRSTSDNRRKGLDLLGKVVMREKTC